jgi:hypothetical protein
MTSLPVIEFLHEKWLLRALASTSFDVPGTRLLKRGFRIGEPGTRKLFTVPRIDEVRQATRTRVGKKVGDFQSCWLPAGQSSLLTILGKHRPTYASELSFHPLGAASQQVNPHQLPERSELQRINALCPWTLVCCTLHSGPSSRSPVCRKRQSAKKLPDSRHSTSLRLRTLKLVPFPNIKPHSPRFD